MAKTTRSSSAARRAPQPAGYPVWAVAAVVVVGLGLIGAAVRVATLDPPSRTAARGGAADPGFSSASAAEPETRIDRAPTPPQKPPRPPVERPRTTRPAPEPEPDPEPDSDPPSDRKPEPPAPTHATAWPRGATEPATVQKVTSGDGLTLADGRRVRLIGISAPDKATPLSAQATELLARLVEGKLVTLEWDQERSDQYGRSLAWVHAGDLFVNGELVRQGLAYCTAWEPNLGHFDELIGLQKEARGARSGVWSLPAPPPADRYVGVRGQHRFHRPDCKQLERVEAARRFELPSREAALDQGEAACTQCQP